MLGCDVSNVIIMHRNLPTGAYYSCQDIFSHSSKVKLLICYHDSVKAVCRKLIA